MPLTSSCVKNAEQRDSDTPLAVQMARALRVMTLDQLPATVIDKVKVCLFDLIG